MQIKKSNQLFFFLHFTTLLKSRKEILHNIYIYYKITCSPVEQKEQKRTDLLIDLSNSRVQTL